MQERENENKIEYISLMDATRLCDYSQEYLSLRVRNGKMKAVKFGRNWFTTKEWLDEYTSRVEEYKETIRLKQLSDTAKIIPEPPVDLPIQPKKIFHLPVFHLPEFRWPALLARHDFAVAKSGGSPKLVFGASLGLVFILLAGGLIFGPTISSLVYETSRGGNAVLSAAKTALMAVGGAPDTAFDKISLFSDGIYRNQLAPSKQLLADFSETVKIKSKELGDIVATIGDAGAQTIIQSQEPFANVGETLGGYTYIYAIYARQIHDKVLGLDFSLAKEMYLPPVEVERVPHAVFGLMGSAFAIVNQDIAGVIDETAIGLWEMSLTGEDINESLANVQGMGRNTLSFLSHQASLGLASLQSASLEALQAADRAVDRGLLSWGERFSDFAKTNIAKAKSGYEFLISPWLEINYHQTAVIKTQALKTVPPAGGSEIKSSSAAGGVVREITKTETVREITRDIRTVDEAALADLYSQIALLRTDMANKLSAPGGVVTQRVYISEPVSAPRIYQQNQDVIVQSIGSGNVMLTAATGMHLAGSQVVIDSTDFSNPLIYLADATKVNGPLTSQTLLVNAPAGFAGNILNVQKEGGAIFSVNTSGNASLVGDFTVAGNLSVGGTQSNSSALSLTASSTAAALTVVQQGSGSIVDLSNSTNAQSAALTVTNLGSGNSFAVNDQAGDASPFVIDAAGNVAIGTTTAAYALQVWGSAAFGTSTTPVLYVDSGTGRVGIGTSNPSSFLDISSATAVASGDAKGQNIYLTANPSATSSASYYGSMSIADYQANYGTNPTYFVMGDWGEGRNSGTATLEN
ncbi:MAG: hypothetical protein AAB620_00580, partial [Patescibacteria group bacterium]